MAESRLRLPWQECRRHDKTCSASSLIHRVSIAHNFRRQLALCKHLLQFLHLGQSLRLPHQGLEPFLLRLCDLHPLALGNTTDISCWSGSGEGFARANGDDGLRKFCRLLECPEKLLGFVTLGVFDFLEVEEADSRVAP